MGHDQKSNQISTHHRYRHEDWDNRRRFLRFLLRTIGMTWLVRLDEVQGLENVPSKGPVLLFINHIALVDPIIVLHVLPRNIIPLAKIEVYNYPVVGIFPRLWGVIPVRREEFDRRAVQMILEVLKAGEIVLVAPEGTRGTSLAQAKEGIAYLASHCSVPLLPVAVQGTRGFPALRFTSRWKQPGAKITIGKPFRYKKELTHPDRDTLRLMTDEAMYVLAGMLPEELRGHYHDLAKATQITLELD